MTEQDVFILSEQALAHVIDWIRDDQWDQQRPTWFQAGGQGNAALRQIVNYHAYDSAWVPDVLASKTLAEVGDRYEFLKTNPSVNYREYSERAIAAALDDPDRIVHLSYGDFPTREYFKHITSVRGFRAFDIARWIGADTRLRSTCSPRRRSRAFVGTSMRFWLGSSSSMIRRCGSMRWCERSSRGPSSRKRASECCCVSRWSSRSSRAIDRGRECRIGGEPGDWTGSSRRWRRIQPAIDPRRHRASRIGRRADEVCQVPLTLDLAVG